MVRCDGGADRARKTEMCAAAASGCARGKACWFAHDYAELRPARRPVNYKTEACHNWAARGECRLGDRCRFAHGEICFQTAADEFWLLTPTGGIIVERLRPAPRDARRRALLAARADPSLAPRAPAARAPRAVAN
jgi:hypothetical protein